MREARSDSRPLNAGTSRLGLSAVSLGTLGQADSSVNIAFPAITAWFQLDIAAIQWLVIAYLLPMSSFVLAFGKLGDLYGHRRIFMIGTLLSLVAHTLSGLAPSYDWLLCLRMFQGIGFGMILGSGPALATFFVHEDQRSHALAMYTMVFGAGMALGPAIGGLLVDQWGWQTVFWYRAPLAAITLALLAAAPESLQAVRQPKLDIVGALLLAASLGSLLLILNALQQASIDLAFVMALLLVFGGASTGFVCQEIRAPEPIIRLSVFRDVDITLLQASSIMINFAGFAVLLLFPFYLAMETDLSLSVAGLVLATSPLGTAMAGLMGTRLALTIGLKRLTSLGPYLTAFGLLAIGLLAPHSTIVVMVIPMFLIGVGLGLFQFAFTDRIVAAMPSGDRGVAGSLFMVTRLLGTVAGASCMSSLLNALMTSDPGDETGRAAMSFVAAFQITFVLVGTALIASHLVMSVFRRI